MIVTLEIPAETKALIRRHGAAAREAPAAFARGLLAAAGAGAESVREDLVRGTLGLTMRNPGSGLAASLFGWMIDDSVPLAALGVPSDSPAARYAGILERGGTIRPRTGRALAIPVSEEARRCTSPRQMTGLWMLKRPGRPPLLVRSGARGALEVHWVLKTSVTIRGRRWMEAGVEGARDTMLAAFGGTVRDYLASWRN